MAGQGLFFRASNLINNCRLLLNNRLTQINQISGVKQKATDKLKELNIPEKPKRPLSPYFKFIQDHRHTIVKQHPEWKITEISRQCARDWRALDPDDKEKYENGFKKQLEVYAKQCVDYSSKLTEEQKEALSKYRKEVKHAKSRRQLKKKKRENNKPKRPIGAYMHYVMEQSQVQGKKYNELLLDLKGKWAELPEKEKAKYIDAALDAKKIYQEELKVWELKMIKEGNLDIGNACLQPSSSAWSDEDTRKCEESQNVVEKADVQSNGKKPETEAATGFLNKLRNFFQR